MYKYKKKAKDNQRAGASAQRAGSRLSEALAKRDYQAVRTTLEATSDWTREERYAYGYALLQSGELAPALAAWAPLVGKYGADFDGDCMLAVQSALDAGSTEQVEWRQLPTATLLALFQAARSLAPDHHALATLRQLTFERLWTEGSGESLKTLLKLLDSPKEPTSSARTWNLAKVRSLLVNPQNLSEVAQVLPAFLSAAAGFAATRLAICPLDLALKGLCEAWFYQLGLKGLRDEASLRRLADLEVAAILDAHSAAGQLGLPLEGGQLLAPSYVVNGDRAGLDSFRAWLRQLPAPVRMPYSAEGYGILVKAAGQANGKKADAPSVDDVFVAEYPFGARLTLQLVVNTLALDQASKLSIESMTRLAAHAESIPTAISQELLSLGLALVANWRGGRNTDVQDLRAVDWITLVGRYLPESLVTEDLQKLQDHLITSMIDVTIKGLSDWPTAIRLFQPYVKDTSTRAQLEAWLTRHAEVERAFELLLAGNLKKKYAVIWGRKATAEQILAFVALLAATGSWMLIKDPELEDRKSLVVYFNIISDLVSDKKINAKVNLASLLADAADCPCRIHFSDLVRNRLPDALAALGHPLPTWQVTPAPFAAPTVNEWQRYFPLREGGPFTLLGVGPNASKSEVMKATMDRMRAQTQSLPDLRAAQAALYSGPSRLIFEFFGFMARPALTPGAPTERPRMALNPRAMPLRGSWSVAHAARS